MGDYVFQGPKYTVKLFEIWVFLVEELAYQPSPYDCFHSIL